MSRTHMSTPAGNDLQEAEQSVVDFDRVITEVNGLRGELDRMRRSKLAELRRLLAAAGDQAEQADAVFGQGWDLAAATTAGVRRQRDVLSCLVMGMVGWVGRLCREHRRLVAEREADRAELERVRRELAAARETLFGAGWRRDIVGRWVAPVSRGWSQ
jgi:hypothetical protein